MGLPAVKGSCITKVCVEASSLNFKKYLQTDYQDPIKLAVDVTSIRFWFDVQLKTNVFKTKAELLREPLNRILNEKLFKIFDGLLQNSEQIEKMKTGSLLLFGEYLKRNTEYPRRQALQDIVLQEVLARFMKGNKTHPFIKRFVDFFSNASVKIVKIFKLSPFISSLGVFRATLEITTADKTVVKGDVFPIGKDAVFGSHFIYYNKNIYHMPAKIIEQIKKIQPAGQTDLLKYEQKDFAPCAFDVLWEQMERDGDKCFKDGNLLSVCNKNWEPLDLLGIGVRLD